MRLIGNIPLKIFNYFFNREIVGNEPGFGQTNVFYQGIQEFGIHSTKIPIPGGIASSHVYTIDWRSDKITQVQSMLIFSINICYLLDGWLIQI